MGANQTAQADAAIAELWRAYHDGLTRVGFSPGDAAALAAAGPLAVLGGFWFGFAGKSGAVEKNMRDLQPRIEDWATRRRAWAEMGHREDGSSYGWERWFPEGRELASAIYLHTAEGTNGSLFDVLVDTAVQTAGDVQVSVGKAGQVVEHIGKNIDLIAIAVGGLACCYLAYRLAR